MAKTHAFIDAETNTLGEHRLPWEIGLIIDFPTGTGEWGFHVEDYYGEMDPEAARVNHFAERFMNDENYQPMPLRAVAKGLSDLLDGAVFVGSNPAFDQGAMRNLFLHAGLIPNWYYRSVDVCTLVSGHLKTYIPSMAAAADAMHIEYDRNELHSALADARLSRDIYYAVMNA